MFNNQGNPAFGYEDIAMRDAHQSTLSGPYDSQIDLADQTSVHSRSPLNPQSRGNKGLPYPSPGVSGPGSTGGPSHPYDPYGESYSPSNPVDQSLKFPTPSAGKVSGWLAGLPVPLQHLILIGPALVLFWIPGILQLTVFHNATAFAVPLFYWSIWLSILWGGYFVALTAARILPLVVRHTVGAVAVSTWRYISWLRILHKYVAFTGWSLSVWISFQPLIDRQQRNPSSKDESFISTVARLLFAFFVCLALLLGEKVLVQLIADKFHERSYAERVDSQKRAINVVTILYANSIDVPGRSDTTDSKTSRKSTAAMLTGKIFSGALKTVQSAATFTSSSLGTVASQLSGGMLEAPNSPQATIESALNSTEKTRLLARRIFYSFCQGKDHLVIADIRPFFPTSDDAAAAFNLFDRDGNGDLTEEELELACMDLHREQLSLANSMRDLDSAVGRLDNILVSLWIAISLVIIAAALDAAVTTLIASAGTLALSLSWLIGSSLQEILTSIVFLFAKHPFDVGDRIEVDSVQYTVKEMRLLSSILLDSNGTLVQMPNATLSPLPIKNMRRSPQMTETFTFDVAYSTTFEQIEDLRVRMLDFSLREKRDFVPAFDVVVEDIPDQAKMTLSADIRYKSNWQSAALTAQRRNKWVCALKQILAELKIYGPSGNPNAVAAPTRFTQVPWEDVQADSQRRARVEASAPPLKSANPADLKLSASTAVLAAEESDVFDQTEVTSHSMQSTSGSRPTAAQVFEA